MSWSVFKKNVLRKTNPNNNPSLNINEAATIWANEYDAAVKRGKDFINLETIQTGNVDLMKTLFLIAFLKGLATPPGVDFSLVNEFGKGVRAYWAGAQMNPFPIPLIPAPGTIQNLAVNSNIVGNVGTWPIYPPIKPAKKQEIMVNMFILAAMIHLFSIGGFIQTTSLYPSAPSPIPGPGIIPWTGYLIPPVIKIPNINFPSADGSEPPVIEEPTDDILSQVGPTQEYEDTSEDTSDDILEGNLTLQDVIVTTLPTDIIDAELQEILPNLIEQLEMGGRKCK
jgi:hypothetical protein|tara:strand:+ start:1915 stop:2760 length:846 start_codon:yes stop_codon:yes gene_type:complete